MIARGDVIATGLVARPRTAARRTAQRPLIGLMLVAVGLVLMVKPSAAGSVLSASAGPSPSSVPAQAERKAAEAYGKLPLAFVPNAGQTDARVRYSAHAGGASFYFTQKEAVFAFSKWAIPLGVLRDGCRERGGYRAPPRSFASGVGSTWTACSRSR